MLSRRKKIKLIKKILKGIFIILVFIEGIIEFFEEDKKERDNKNGSDLKSER